MDVSLKVTDQPQESSFFDMVSGDSVLSIPLFQRAYRWQKKNLDWLISDINDIRDDAAKSVFLGVVVCVVRGASPGRPIPWEIVDGQQRLSTLYLMIMAAAEILARNGQTTDAAGIIGTYLLVRPLALNPINTKLIPSSADRAQFKKIWDQILMAPNLALDPTIQSNPPKPPSPSGSDTGAMIKQYAALKKYLQKLWNEQGKEAIDKFVEISANRLSVVSISLRDPIVAPKIFERLNNRAELVTIADLVRNEVFARVSDDPASAKFVFESQWEPFVSSFTEIDNGLEKFLFPYGLIIKSSVTKAELFSLIRKYWATLSSPKEIIEDLSQYLNTFLVLEGSQRLDGMSDALYESLDRISRLGKPSSTYAFLLRLVVGVHKCEVSEAEAIKTIPAIEDFLFRRAICGIEPTGLHAVFKGLWCELIGEENDFTRITAENLIASIRSKPTVSWPSDNDFGESIKSGDLYHRKVVGFALREYESACRGDSANEDFHVEHVLPQTSTPYWQAIFGKEYDDVVHTWANLVPLSTVMNPSVGQGDFTAKADAFRGSMYSSARDLASKYESWDMNNLKTRANELVTWALNRWPNSAA